MTTIADIRAKYPQYNDMSDEQLAGALHRKFYSDMPQEEFNQRIGFTPQQAAPAVQGNAPASPTPDGAAPTLSYDDAAKELSATTQNPVKAQYDALPAWEKPLVAAKDAIDLVVDGATYGFGDKLAAAARAPFTGKTYDQELADQRRQTRAAELRAGGAAPVAEIGGAIATPTALASKGVSLMGKGIKGALAEGSIYGGLNAAGHDEPISEGATLGAAAGVGGHALGEAIGGVAGAIGKRVGRAPALTVEELHAAGDAAAKRADDAGVIIRRDGVQKLVKRFEDVMADHGAIPENEPGVFGAWKRLASMAGEDNATLKGIYSVRKALGNSFNPQNRSQNALATKLVNVMDDYIDGLAAGASDSKNALAKAGAPSTGHPDVVAGDPKVAADSLKEMRGLWHRMRKLETAQKLVQKAERRAGSTGAGGNVDNATRQNLRQLLDNEKMARGFTPDEQAALDKAVMGTQGQNALRLVGKLAPTGVVPAGIGASMGSAIGGALAGTPGSIVGSFVPPALGTAAKMMADRITRDRVADLTHLIASGGNAAAIAPANVFTRAAEVVPDPIARAFMATGVNRSAGVFQK